MSTVPDPSASESTLAVRHWLERHKAGDALARQELLEISMRRLRLLARRILKDIPRVRSFEETDDLLQNSVVRLWKYLSDHQPETPFDYFRLAACMIRRELIDLSRRHAGHMVNGTNAAGSTAEDDSIGQSRPLLLAGEDTLDPEKLSRWTEFHEYVERLPEVDRSLFDLLWYQGLTMAETSELLAIPLRTLGRRWKLVRVRLYRDLLSEPGEEEFT
ncbi:MAG: sigma-70 family RNA polymerase sigma factor [Planctomycetaceae bacterium]|nr:sigma-70 family RNA polymerase sigma factor [Planctomycetaceae bacterium]